MDGPSAPGAGRALTWLWHAGVVAFGLAVSVSLVARVPDLNVRAALLRYEGWQPQARPMETLAQHEGEPGSTLRARMRVGEAQVARIAAEVHFPIATNGPTVVVEYARLTMLGAACVFEATPGQPLVDNTYLALRRSGECPPQPPDTKGRLELLIKTRDTARLSLWTAAPNAIWVPADESLVLDQAAPGTPTRAHGVQARWVSPTPPSDTRRWQLLAYLWNVRLPAWWIWIVLALVLPLIGAAGPMPAEAGTRRAVVSAGAAASAIAVLYAVIIPPLQAVDEPSHIITFAHHNGRSDWSEAIERLNVRGHFPRLQAQSYERFYPIDRERRAREEWRWQDTVVQDLSQRSPGVAAWWRLVGAAAFQLTGAEALLFLRVMNAALFGIGVAAATALVLRGQRTEVRAAHPWVVLLVPALPFFGMHVSNHAPLLATYLVAGAAVVRAIRGGRVGVAEALALGSATALAIVMSGAALPLLPAVFMVMASRLCVAALTSGGQSDAVSAWTAFTTPLVIGIVLGFPGAMPGGEPVGIGRAWVATAVAVAGVLAAATEWSVTRAARQYLAVSRTVGRLLLAGGVAATALLTAALVSPWVAPAAPLRQIGANTPIWGYIGEVFAAATGLFTAYPPDFLLTASFWGGFGWLDAMPPAPLIFSCSAAAGVLLTLSVARDTVHGNAGALALRVPLLAGTVLALAAYAAAAARVGYGVHGRYLIGWWVLLLAPAWAMLIGAAARWPRALPLATALTSLALHAFCAQVILTRYFGDL